MPENRRPKKLGTTILEAMPRREILDLLTNYTHADIAKKYNVTECQVSIILTKKIDLYKHPKKMKKIVDGEFDKKYEDDPFRVKAFSDNEDDYGNMRESKHRVTKQGLVVYENDYIIPKVTPFMRAANNYKIMLNRYYGGNNSTLGRQGVN